jgi:hypothetical protein
MLQPSGIATRLFFVLISALVLVLTMPRVIAAQSQGQQVTICHRTGSPTTPWVFMSIDASTLAEHEAQGDIRANSLADCPSPTPVPSPQPTSQPTIQPTVALQTLPTPLPPPPPATPTPRPVPTAQPTSAAALPTVEVAGAQPTAIGQAPVPEVSTLPTSGGEPNRPALVLALLAFGGLGVSLRRLARRRR